MNIGITINLRTHIFSNGVNQNAIYFANLLKEIGYTPYLIYDGDNEFEDINEINTIHIDKSFNIKFDIIVQFGLAIQDQFMNKFKEANKSIKLVAYECGNKFIMDMENILFKKEEDSVILTRSTPDQTWAIPQMEKSSMDYYKLINRQERATVVPFIWEPLVIEDRMSEMGFGTYTPREINRIGVLESNISVMKNVVFPVMAIEKYYRERKDLDSVTLFGSDSIKHSSTFISLTQLTEIYADKKLFAHKRKETVDVLNEMVDLIVSWQWENNLNYLWIDAAWMGWPVVHNGSLCQDIGYYYEEFNANVAVDQIKSAIDTHNQDADYLKRNREIIKRYTHQNEKLKEQYKMLIENAVAGEFKEYTYDWKTNSIS